MSLFSGGNIADMLGAGGAYYLGNEASDIARQGGEEARNLANQAATTSRAESAFQPYTVTSNLANIGTTAQGGYNLNLSPQQQQLQNQLLGQSQQLFGQVGQDPAARAQGIYEQIRATQQPGEERDRLQMQENLFAGGRGGIQTAQYGGSPEQFAYEQARAESQNTAALGARERVLAEEAQALNSAQGLMTAGYNPQQQALSLLEGSQIPAGYASAGQRTGADLSSQLRGRGIESYVQGQDLGNRIDLQTQDAILGLLTGQQMSPLQQAQIAEIYAGMGQEAPGGGGLIGKGFDWLFGGGGNSGYGNIGDPFADNFGGN
tara:strand:+ start:160 stop:1116 length:957 start_codon:yes stop_codon:yes gene_type:complete